MKVNSFVFGLIFSSLICIVMALIMSFVVLALNVGFTEDFFLRWITSIGVEFLIALPVSMLVIPMIQKGLSKFLIIK
ncbi:DUF2798 domain-containing protein [Aureivirga marina]|uniref:DUF2798 domain-containing protein n=1 Tax=Aureivirga marina TaxID=1182451 RepID=UPI0018CBDF6C|nr:DUF2798 domain-containing protein [Aureivirga marina]